MPQAWLDRPQKQSDEAFSALKAEPSSGLARERYEELKDSLHKAEDAVCSLASAVSTLSGYVSRTIIVTRSFAYCWMRCKPFPGQHDIL